MARSLVVALLVSGEGTTLDALAEEIAGGHLPVRVALVVADRPHAPAVEKARRRGLPTSVVPFRGEEPERWSDRVTQLLRDAGTELVVLAGFLAVLPPSFVGAWPGRILNLHPSLLPLHGGPGMYGIEVQRAVLASGARETGATVHVVTSELDRGPIVAQAKVAVLPGDTPESLRDRLRPVERALLFGVLRRIAEGALPLPLEHVPPSARSPDGAAGR